MLECQRVTTLLGYAKWDNFINNVVVKAKKRAGMRGENMRDHFPDVGKVIIDEAWC